ncbi:hypothetical protein AK812_SmicGene38610 [Symbiodinium microadriaticum]|uniref:Uncharacterized protein n=1 Tax=Symbiodinium microadriaticum TaxID=2951 RepID=A0A1Q9CDB2_SYMMI|nr:hypothetical protein AK812_SmicGene38610 [Symbiodinium microadriaticum]
MHVIFRWREQCALVRRAVNDREKVQSQGDVKARGCSAAQVLAAQGSRALRAQEGVHAETHSVSTAENASAVLDRHNADEPGSFTRKYFKGFTCGS